MSEVEKNLIFLKYNEDLSIKDIAEALNLTEENVKVRLFRVKKKLLNLLGTVTLAGKKGDVVFTTDTNTQVTMGKEAKTLADVKAGDVVTIKSRMLMVRNLP